MLVFWHQKLTMLATPKTGTTAVESALESLAHVVIQRPPQLKHASVRKYHRFIGPWLESAAGHPFTVIATMREPLDWLGSWYRYRQREDLANEKKSTAGISFDAFVRAYCSESPPDYAAVGAQSQFLAPKNERGLDRLFRYEKIEDLIEFLEDRLACEIILPRLNVSPIAAMDLEPGTEKLLRKVAARDFELYDQLCQAG
ncbi:hypothetical protein KM031_01245 [Gemmobacter fulvus]|uniref:Gamma-glutamyl kinase n=1 Tax=Gemmobacter fulvus TaxID=2840474 RepID=A0A975S1F4_9RHOB|nr:hypothetical protein [Gemmobacter fulvus]MBT9245080.1 hypothetical protein [Gemmobacter fulvus]MDQ1847947.1 hypothetical protein [Gemmobacter fulvus]QWK90577.1 hypothetical protein KM031_01245 [Gemmobacter fulvus]